jgi:heterodisulfide reductase subunit B2
MKYALFLGCTIPVRSTNYEMSARKVLAKLGIETADVEGFSCCGFTMRSIDEGCAELMAAYNLAMVSKEGMGMLTLCSACTSMLTEVNRRLAEDGHYRKEINEKLSKLGREYTNPVKIRHFARLLYEEAGLDNIRKQILNKLDSLKVGVHYGCHYTKPSEIYEQFDNPEIPHTIDDIIQVTGARTIDYETRLGCCGGAVLGIDEQVALAMARGKLRNLGDSAVDAMVLVCPFCSVMFDDNQKKIENKFSEHYDLPVIYLPQLLGMAMGMEAKDLGLKMNKISAQKVLEKVQASSVTK